MSSRPWKTTRTTVLLAVLALSAGAGTVHAGQADPPVIPVESFTLPNGLKVVVSPDPSAPVVLIDVMYKIGFRIEPKGRTGFAHLFEHLMFQG